MYHRCRIIYKSYTKKTNFLGSFVEDYKKEYLAVSRKNVLQKGKSIQNDYEKCYECHIYFAGALKNDGSEPPVLAVKVHRNISV